MATKKLLKLLSSHGYKEHRENYSGFAVIGAGLSRTGTSSLKAALQILLDGKCYHGVEIFNASPQDPDFEIWKRALREGHISKDNLLTLFDARGYRAGTDLPLALFYKWVDIGKAKNVLY